MPSPPPRGPAKGWITGYVTTLVSQFDAAGRVTHRVPRDAVPLPQGGLPFYAGPGALIVADISGREVLLDASEFQVRMAESQVKETCSELKQRGQTPGRTSPASMGHGGRC